MLHRPPCCFEFFVDFAVRRSQKRFGTRGNPSTQKNMDGTQIDDCLHLFGTGLEMAKSDMQLLRITIPSRNMMETAEVSTKLG